MHRRITGILVSLLLAGCGPHPDSPPQPYNMAISISSKQDTEYINTELDAQEIEFRIYEAKGKRYIAFHKEQQEMVKEIINRAYSQGSAPIGYVGLCAETEAVARKNSDQLSQLGIPMEVRQTSFGFCWYWPEEYTEKVGEIDNTYKQIQANQEAVKSDT